MSPLVRLLLALAALLAAADANCNQKRLGYATLNNFTLPIINLPPVGDVLNVAKDYYLGSVVGVKLVACNKNPLGPAPAIEVYDVRPDSGEVAVVCYDDFCPEGATLEITQFYEDD